MKLSIEDRLGQICQKINDNGFYVGFYSQEDFANSPSETKKNIEEEVSFKKYNNFLHSPFEAVNPHLETTILYKVDSRLFKAFPIHWDKKAFERFFVPSVLVEKLSGIVIVSHRLKMLSFLWACYDPIDQDEEHLALWFNLKRATQWASLVNFLDESRECPIFHPNPLHSSYYSAFACRRGSSIAPWEICLSIEDHWKNEILYKKVCTQLDIDQLNSSILSLKSMIDRQEKKILEFNNRINTQIQEFEQYKIDIYESKVNAELQNIE